MKPVSYRSPALAASGGPQDLALDGVLAAGPQVMFCDKCKFATLDPAAFRKHMMEHLQPKFYCFYCNNVFRSEAELSVHLKEHMSGHPFTCPHCGQGYMRRMFLVKHIERVHSKHSQELAKAGPPLNSYLLASDALPAASTVNPPPPHRPAVRLTVPATNSPSVRLDKDERRGKTLDTNTSVVIRDTEHLPSGNEPRNRALTVSLPEEVSIPAGCLVELVEVKTVNGKKELKLRLFSQQDDESVIKDARNSSVCPSSAPASLLSSSPNHQSSTLKSGCVVNRELGAAKVASLQRPAGVPAISKQLQVNKDKSGLKRTSQEVINLVSDSIIPNKIPKTLLSPLSERSNGMRVLQREPLYPKTSAPPVSSSRAAPRLTSSRQPDVKLVAVSQKAAEQRMTMIPEAPKSAPTQRAGDAKVAVKVEPREIHLRNNNNSAASTIKKEAVSLDQQRPAATKSQTPTISLCKSNVLNRTFPSVLSKSKISNQDLNPGDRAGGRATSEPESFPVISSVFSLSQHPEQAPGAFQPLVMALRGMVMDKNNRCDSTTAQGRIEVMNGAENNKKIQTSAVCSPATTKTEPIAGVPKCLQTGPCIGSVKKEDAVKQENHGTLSKVLIDVKVEKTESAPASKSPTEQESVAEAVTTVDVSVGTEPLRKREKSEQDVPKFLTVSLRRVQMGLWEKLTNGQKLRTSKCKTHPSEGGSADGGAIYPMPLRKDQRVKKPGPYQPIVVLNHPRPRSPERGTRASDTVSDAGAPGALPKCHILKMRLSKVMGQKYEVMGCTVGVVP